MKELLIFTAIFISVLLLSFLAGSIYTKKKLSKLAREEFDRASKAMRKAKPIASFNFFPGSEQYRPVLPWLGKKYSAIDTLYLWHDSNEFEIYGAWTRAGENEIDPYPIRINFSEIDDPNEIIRLGESIISVGREFQLKRDKELNA